jgi:putative DNA methylase
MFFGMNGGSAAQGLAPFSLKDTPSMIERVFPAQKIGAEAQKERKAGAGQTLTAFGSYWKGRKPLVLVRACVLASLLPATDDLDGDLELFEMLMRMDPDGMLLRNPDITADMAFRCPQVSDEVKDRHISSDGGIGTANSLKWRRFQSNSEQSKESRNTNRAVYDEERDEIRKRVISVMPFSQLVEISERVEKVEDVGVPCDSFYDEPLRRANARIGTTAHSLPELIEQLGLARFGRRPVVGDPFSGGGSIPFESARVGCDVIASDLNPIAAMLTSGALQIIGATESARDALTREQSRVAEEVDQEITKLGIEHDRDGNRAKAFLYCLEIKDPDTGWLVPMAVNWIISAKRRVVASLKPDYARMRFDIAVEEGVDSARMKAAEQGTVQGRYVVSR